MDWRAKWFTENWIFLEIPHDSKPLSQCVSTTKIFNTENTPILLDENINCISPNSIGSVWIGTVGGRLLRWSPEKDRLEEWYNGEGLQQLRNIILSENGNQLWLGCGNGLFCFDLGSKSIIQPKWFAPIDYVVHMGWYKKELWIGSRDAIHVLNPLLKKSRVYRIGNESPGLTNTMITHLFDADSMLWFSTFGGGLHQFNPRNGVFSSVTESDGLSNNNVWAVYPDKSGALWMSTDNGICKYDLKTLEIIQLQKSAGFNFDDYSMKAHCQFPNGQLAFGNLLGLNVFSPDKWQTNPFLPPPIITEIEVNYIIKKFKAAETLVLNPEDKSISFYFCGLNYRNSFKNKYKVRLAGFDKDWIERNSNQRNATYTDLPAGDYQFEVMAANDAGLWNEEVAALAILVLPPFYKTTWFRLLIILLAISVISSLVYLYNRRKYLRTIGRLQVVERIQNERQRISRDLHDHVGAHLTKVISDLDLLRLKMSHQNQNEQLESIEQTRTFTQSTVQLLRDTIWAINKDQYTVQEFADKVEAFLKQFLNEVLEWKLIRSIEINRELSPNEVLNLLRILQEASQNMLKYAKASLFEVQIVSDSKKLQMIISDNGQGLQKSIEKREHYGLLNIKKRATDIAARFDLESIPSHGLTISITIEH